ncbi:MAG: hypothetical protein GC155_06065 [Alphaproteobacteria bacterium]|nr:hypothetical protein [Alphaproteobacteria bacterium]
MPFATLLLIWLVGGLLVSLYIAAWDPPPPDIPGWGVALVIVLWPLSVPILLVANAVGWLISLTVEEDD